MRVIQITKMRLKLTKTKKIPKKIINNLSKISASEWIPKPKGNVLLDKANKSDQSFTLNVNYHIDINAIILFLYDLHIGICYCFDFSALRMFGQIESFTISARHTFDETFDSVLSF